MNCVLIKRFSFPSILLYTENMLSIEMPELTRAPENTEIFYLENNTSGAYLLINMLTKQNDDVYVLAEN